MTRLPINYSALLACFCCLSTGTYVTIGTPSEDINGCQTYTYNSCSQRCTKSEGSFQCSCEEGFKVGDRDNKSCEANDPNWKLIYATRQHIKYTTHDGPDKVEVQVTPNPGRPVGVTYDARSGFIFWTDASANSASIYRKSITGNGSAEIIADTGIVLPEGIAYDWITGNVYFADSNLSHISVCGNSSNFCSILVQEVLDLPRDIALHPNKGIMFWTDWGQNPAIMRAYMDGSFPTPIVITDLKWPNGITIDQGSDRIYWGDAGMDRIETMMLDGRDRHVVISIRTSHPFGVDIFGDRIFWSDWTNFNIKSANKMTGVQRKIHVTETGVLMNGLAVFHTANQPIKRSNPCRDARCSHICTLSSVSNFRCLCPVGMTLDMDGKSCVDPNNTEKLVIVFKNIIKIMRFNSIGRDVFQSIPFPELKSISAVVYNPVNHTIILSDSSHKRIYEYNIDMKRLTVLIDQHLDSVTGMDIDVVGENLYWVDGGRETVEVMSFRTRARMVLMTGVENPTDILVVPKLGVASSLYLSRSGTRGGEINMMLMNGFNNIVIQRVDDKEPIALAYDKELDNILWVDKVNRSIESTSTDGKSTSVLISHQPGPPSDVIKHGNQIYWTDMSSGDLKFLSLGTQYVRSIKIGSFESNSSQSAAARVEINNHTVFYPKMTVINKDMSYLNMLLDGHECSLKNPKRKQCSHTCAMAGPDLTGICLCPEGHTLDEDGITCQKPSSCSQDQFTCQDGHCISRQYICDGVADCSNHDDEVNCKDKDTKCDVDKFKCESNGICIAAHWVCDGESDCPDGADESACHFTQGCNMDFDFRCDSGRCIPKSWQCDHAFDCPDDKSDERGCNFSCPDGYFTCATAENCIAGERVCDKERDCEDGSDELNCDDIPEATPPTDDEQDGNSNITIVPVVMGLPECGGGGETAVIIVLGVLILILVGIIVAIIFYKQTAIECLRHSKTNPKEKVCWKDEDILLFP